MQAIVFLLLGVTGNVHLLCTEPNDLLDLLRNVNPTADYSCVSGTLDAVVSSAAIGDSVLSLAPEYPTQTTDVSNATKQAIAGKRLKVYIEYPTAPRATSVLQRAVVAEDGLFATLQKGRLLNPHAVPFTDMTGVVSADKVYLFFAKVAGYDTAVDGLPPTGVVPFLFQAGSILFGATQISNFRTQRYAPHAAWSEVLAVLLTSVGILPEGTQPSALKWSPDVVPMYNATETLPSTAEVDAVTRGVTWYAVAGMLPDSARVMESIPFKKANKFYPKLFNGTATGRMGVFEGFQSSINSAGTQPTSLSFRGDCMAETAMSFAVLSAIQAKNLSTTGSSMLPPGRVGRNILNYAWVHGGFSQPWVPGIGLNEAGNFFGMLSWSSQTNVSQLEYYKDDTARGLMGGMAASAFLGDRQWDDTLALGILGTFRWTGTNGFGPQSGGFAAMTGGWETTFNKPGTPQYSPHYQGYMWAVYLWGYKVSGYQPLYDRTYAAIKLMMTNYPAKWIPTSNGITMQRARMILPLVWLVRITDTEETRGWLQTIIDGLMTRQQACGAFMEEVSAPGWGGGARVPDNSNYGTFEAPLNQVNTDPVADMLYTQNFALLGLHEAAAILPQYQAAADKIADFMVRIQARSTAHPELNGGYMRAFDFSKWEVWASDADLGWGAWSIETGWTQSWVTATLGMRVLKVSLWEKSLENVSGVKEAFDEWLPYLDL